MSIMLKFILFLICFTSTFIILFLLGYFTIHSFIHIRLAGFLPCYGWLHSIQFSPIIPTHPFLLGLDP
jgi:hypothetical protein